MIEERGFRPTSYFHSLSSAAALTICLVGLSVLAGWTLGLRALTSVFPGLATMKANTAACFVLASVALWGRAADGVAMARRRLATLCAALVAVIALLTLFEYLVRNGRAYLRFFFIESRSAEITHDAGTE